MRRAVLPILALVALIAVVVVGLAQAGGGGEEGAAFDLQAAKRELAGAPAPLAALHADANALLPGGPAAFRARLAALRGHPVVVNKWASWCGPCQAEFPAFQQQATKRGKEVAFLGVNAKDQRGQATTFLRDTPVPFPSYEDPRERIARRYELGRFFPTTLFIDAQGRTAYVHQGQYRAEADLARDIDRYLLR